MANFKITSGGGVYGTSLEINNGTAGITSYGRISGESINIGASSSNNYIYNINDAFSGTYINALSMCIAYVPSSNASSYTIGTSPLTYGGHCPNYIISLASSDVILYLPANPCPGQTLFIQKVAGGNINVKTTGTAHIQDGAQWNTSYDDNYWVERGDIHMFVVMNVTANGNYLKWKGTRISN